MSDSDRFHYILGRSRTRESSTLTIATVAASASLILLILFVETDIEVEKIAGNTSTNTQLITQKWENFQKPFLALLGSLFSLAGIVYREVTKYSIHRKDERWLRTWVSKCNRMDLIDKKGNKIEDPLYNNRGDRTREIGIRSLLLMPIIAWLLMWFSIDNHLALGIAVLMHIAYPLALSSCERKYAPVTQD